MQEFEGGEIEMFVAAHYRDRPELGAAPKTVEIWTTSISLGPGIDAPFAGRRRAQ
ncbi:hypothetical protein HFN76_35575 [Rhizobium laguerreae]|uniref:hypothetical protein n=1 Tax=Rhizobium laguerreae TaxID=1076926 RepID=UPI001C91692A|nr:hypothetical protein [Rhizobium laguerreae]MBY3517378.1 hypothetical protein [Rhizobium laguerreae]